MTSRIPATHIIFDLDGTLIDSAPDIHRAINLLLAQLGGEPLSLPELRGFVGDGSVALIQRAFAARHITHSDETTALQAFLDFYAEQPTAQTRVYPGVPETLELLRARGHQLALCTNKAFSLAETILQRLDLRQYFSQVLGGDSLPFRKPDPRILHHLLGACARSPGAALLVGDSEIDAATARSAGLPFVLMTYGYHRGDLAEIPRDAAVHDIRRLPELITPG